MLQGTTTKEIPNTIEYMDKLNPLNAKQYTHTQRRMQVRVNFANPDMVGHTGNLEATIKSCALCDGCVQELLDVCDEVNGR